MTGRARRTTATSPHRAPGRTEMADAPPLGDALDLLDWRRRVFELYAEVRGTQDPQAGWARWRASRDGLFATHTQSPLPADTRRTFTGLRYFGYDPALRVLADVEAVPADGIDLPGSAGESFAATRVGVARFRLDGRDVSLSLYWLEGYAGGLFLSFRDETSGAETYGAGRYLLDTVKGADLGPEDGRIVLDFNYAYNPSCAYDPEWACPLAPPDNTLSVAIRAGERLG